MSTWKAKALELFPELKDHFASMPDRQTLWAEVQRKFHSAKNRGDDGIASQCMKYAAWTLHPAPQAKTISDVSDAAAHLIYAHADNLHRWIDRHDFMTAQKGLRFHLGDDVYDELQAHFFENIDQYPQMRRPIK